MHINPPCEIRHSKGVTDGNKGFFFKATSKYINYSDPEKDGESGAFVLSNIFDIKEKDWSFFIEINITNVIHEVLEEENWTEI
jgi:hypothetical protein